MLYFLLYCSVSAICCGRPDFQDVERIRTLVTMLAADMANSVADSGHAYAMSYSSRHLTPAAELAERFSGLQQVYKVIDKYIN